ncbi:hypothetical protein OOO55_005166, partial [Salmonella enterica]|nr:hypothetical protein [Salmonella enterica]
MENAGLDGKGYRESGVGDYVLRPEVSGDGTGFRALGDNHLRSVVVEALSRGKGSALKVENGTLSSDKGITGTSSGEQGTAVVLRGGSIQADGDVPVTVTADASGDSGTAVKVEQAESVDGAVAASSLKNINLQASSDKGTVLDVGGNLSSDRDISVSTTDGTALVLSGGGLTGTDAARPVTVTASATGEAGTAVRVEKTVTEDGVQTSSSLKDVLLTTSSTKGDALNVEGRLETQNTEIKA